VGFYLEKINYKKQISFLIRIKFNLEKGGLVFLIGFFVVVILTVASLPILKELHE